MKLKIEITCPVCIESTVLFSFGNYRSGDLSTTIPIYYCKKCNTFIKIIDPDLISSYLKKSGYTDLNYEQESYNHRIDFFNYIFNLTRKQNIATDSWLDYGCSFGHLVGFLKNMGIESYGIEISDEIRDYALKRGIGIYKRLEELPIEMRFGVVSFIDSFYYSETPELLLKKVYNLLYDDGLLVLRMTNRNWLVKFDKYIRRRQICTALIDHTIGYSKKSMFHLLRKNGFEILETTFIERGKYRTGKDKLFYFIAVFINYISLGLVNFLPGFVIIAQKNRHHTY